MRLRLRTLVTHLSISLALLGCAGTKEAVLPQDGPSMQAIYAAHVLEMAAEEPVALRAALGARGPAEPAALPEGYSREAQNELDTTFPRLPNPALILYVFPHLAGPERVPVPGYVTTFPLYERVEYALPGEVPLER